MHLEASRQVCSYITYIWRAQVHLFFVVFQSFEWVRLFCRPAYRLLGNLVLGDYSKSLRTLIGIQSYTR